jgi:maltose/moltooligosaccharide transporter
MQSAFTGLGQTLAYLAPTIMLLLGMDKDAVNAHHVPHVTIAAFLVGAVFSIASILWSVRTTPELPLSDAERERMRRQPRGLGAALREIGDALREMPPTMRQLAWMKLFQWYAMFCYWQYVVLSLASTLYGSTDPASPALRDASLLNGQLGGFYNAVAFVAAFTMLPFARRFGPKLTHAACLVLAGLGMLAIPLIHAPGWLFLPMVGIGLAWASIMGNPYVLLAGSIPAHRTGVYMGIFNMFIVLPMLLQIATLPLVYGPWLGGHPENVIRLAGALLLVAATCVLRVRPLPAAQPAVS